MSQYPSEFSHLEKQVKYVAESNISQRWFGRQLYNSSMLAYNIAHPSAKLQKNQNALEKNPLHVASFVCLDFKSPIEELVIARYRDGWITALIFTRTAVSQQLLNAINTSKVSSIWATEFTDDKRNRAALTTTCDDASELQHMSNFINLADRLANLDPQIKTYISSVFDPSNSEASPIFTLPLNEDLRPPYFKYKPHTAYIGGPSYYHSHSDAVMPKEVPPLHVAIAYGDFLSVQQIISENPWSVFSRDPMLCTAIEHARKFPFVDIFKYLVATRGMLVPSDDKAQQNYELIPLKQKNFTAVEQEERALNYFNELEFSVLPIRSPLHAACITGDIQTVKDILSSVPKSAHSTLLEEFDPLGFKPLILAAANGHAEITKYLIGFGASLQNYYYEGNICYRLIDHAATPAVMAEILYHMVDPDVTHGRLTEAVKKNDYEMTKVLLLYMRKLQTDRVGLTPFDIVIKSSTPSNTNLLELFFKYWEDYVPEGPYDDDIPKEICDKLTKHNEKIQKKIRLKHSQPILKSMEYYESSIKTSLIRQDGSQITSTIKTKASLTSEEYSECYSLFMNTFQMRVDDSDQKRKAYFDNLFKTENENSLSCIDLVTLQNREGHKEIISFQAFECKQEAHESVGGKFLLFHGQLAANNPKHQSLGLANLTFRVSLAMKKLSKENPVIVFIKAIQPGYGICLLPRPIRFFPKYKIDQGLMKHIVSLTGEELNGTKMVAKLKVINHAVSELNFPLELYKYFIGSQDEDAMAAAYFINEEAIEDYVTQLRFHGIDQKNMNEFALLWEKFTIDHKMNMTIQGTGEAVPLKVQTDASLVSQPTMPINLFKGSFFSNNIQNTQVTEEKMIKEFVTFLATDGQEGIAPETIAAKLILERDDAQLQLDKLFNKIRHGFSKEVGMLNLDDAITWLKNNQKTDEFQALTEQRLHVFQLESKLQSHCKKRQVIDYYTQALEIKSSAQLSNR